MFSASLLTYRNIPRNLYKDKDQDCPESHSTHVRRRFKGIIPPSNKKSICNMLLEKQSCYKENDVCMRMDSNKHRSDVDIGEHLHL